MPVFPGCVHGQKFPGLRPWQGDTNHRPGELLPATFPRVDLDYNTVGNCITQVPHKSQTYRLPHNSMPRQFSNHLQVFYFFPFSFSNCSTRQNNRSSRPLFSVCLTILSCCSVIKSKRNFSLANSPC